MIFKYAVELTRAELEGLKPVIINGEIFYEYPVIYCFENEAIATSNFQDQGESPGASLRFQIDPPKQGCFERQKGPFLDENDKFNEI